MLGRKLKIKLKNSVAMYMDAEACKVKKLVNEEKLCYVLIGSVSIPKLLQCFVTLRLLIYDKVVIDDSCRSDGVYFAVFSRGQRKRDQLQNELCVTSFLNSYVWSLELCKKFRSK